MSNIHRRDFIRSTVALGAGAAATGRWPAQLRAQARQGAGVPLIVTSHTNETGQEGLRQGWEILSSGGAPMDAVERCANVIEVDPDDSSVGYGGLPNALGVVQLDASCMDGRTYAAGAVASLEGIKTPASIARLVMEHTDHVLMVGPGAQQLALDFGYQLEDLMTERSRQSWIRWRERLSDTDDYGPPEHLANRRSGDGLGGLLEGPEDFHYGTTNVLAVDASGDVSGITTTSGLSWKVPGRVGDSPIIGAGLYVDNSVGAAGATGRGEDVIKSCASYFIVMRMREGRTPQQACEDAIDMIVDRYRAIGNDFVPGEKFVAINKAGEFGCSSMPSGRNARMTVMHTGGLETYEGSTRG
ncbi:MAG: N(4)-(beta-N-acetylglucosaminyl)-L-asparaginase [Gemmatimonadota bacterium]